MTDNVGHCSEPNTQLSRKWVQERDSNPRPSAYEAAELPLLHPAICFVLTIGR